MIIGIDLGTTNSAAAVWRDGKAELIPNSLGDYLTPSAVSISDKGDVLTGMAARERQSTDPARTATGFKRLIGTQEKVKLGRKEFLPEDLSSLILASIKADAEAFLGEPVEEAVITVPAYFNEQQRRATQKAAQMAGLKVDRLINEPTAAALGFGIHELEKEHPFLVFDLGGGTFDVSIVEIFDGIIEVRSSAGDPRLGGLDFNEAVIALAAEQLGEKVKPLLQNPDCAGVMREAAERARRTLSDHASADFKFVWQGEEYKTELTADDFEKQAEGLINRLREPVLRALRDGGIRSKELSEVVLVGGGTRMPVVRKAVTRLFGRFPNHSLHPDHAVALGAAVQAGLRTRNSDLKEIRMTDVCPFSLGVDVAEYDQFGNMRSGIFAPIIERNRTIPTSKVNVFSTMADNQREVRFGVYQGEARHVASNVKLGEIKIKVPPKPAGHVQVECRFSYDVSGLLEVDITVPETGQKEQHIFGGEGLEKDDMEQRRAMLAKMKVHPRDDSLNAAVMARAKRCFESLLGDERDYVGRLLLAYEGVLDRQEKREIDEFREQLVTELDRIEGERYL
ncbi:Hsp70 family protein [Sphingorhabdus arenilitoris]|uniref:Hsp70 family protein n=1 Tax=Sphingorhabdus arenilitoris TaxID=1490041 RepID=A0ABV8RE47_9SPHN